MQKLCICTGSQPRVAGTVSALRSSLGRSLTSARKPGPPPELCMALKHGSRTHSRRDLRAMLRSLQRSSQDLNKSVM